MNIQACKAWCVRHRNEIGIGIAVFALTVIVDVTCFYTPRPQLVNPPSSTRDTKVTLTGKVSPHRSVTVFDALGNALIVVNPTEAGEFTVTDLPIGEGENIFTLRAIASRWRVSFPVTLRIQKDTLAPGLSMNSLQGATITGSNTVVSGKAEPGSSITVNGVKTTVNEDGSWSTTVALKPGANAVTVAATDPAGNVTTQTQTIQYTPSAPDSQTGTATVTTSTTMTSHGSLPASTTSTSPTATVPSSPSSTPTSSTPTPAPTPSAAPAPTPAPQPILAIIASAWVSNGSPNARSNETIYASVKDNYGRPVIGASVIAAVHYKSGTQHYSLVSNGNGNYSTSFKLFDKLVSGYKVNVTVTATHQGFTSTAATSFTPQ